MACREAAALLSATRAAGPVFYSCSARLKRKWCVLYLRHNHKIAKGAVAQDSEHIRSCTLSHLDRLEIGGIVMPPPEKLLATTPGNQIPPVSRSMCVAAALRASRPASDDSEPLGLHLTTLSL